MAELPAKLEQDENLRFEIDVLPRIRELTEELWATTLWKIATDEERDVILSFVRAAWAAGIYDGWSISAREVIKRLGYKLPGPKFTV